MNRDTARLGWVDNLRTATIVLVVNMHACVTYSHVGGWYLNEGPEPALPARVVFILWQAGLQSFFMGLLFFLAGFFAHRSLARHGAARFLRERTIRLAVPALLYMGLIHPFMVYVLLGRGGGPGGASLSARYWDYLATGRVLHGNGPLWFVLALLLFSAVLAGWRRVRPLPAGADGAAPPAPPVASRLLAWAMAAGLATFAVRVVQPIGTSVFNFQLCYFPQYIVAFAAGVAAGRDGWLEALAGSRVARVAGWLGLVGGPGLLVVLMVVGGPPPEQGPNLYAGGVNGRALALALWEQLAGLSLALGMMALFRSCIAQEGRIARWLSARSFAVYVLHAPVLVALTPWLRPLGGGPFVKATVLTFLGMAASLAAAEVARRLPGLRRIL